MDNLLMKAGLAFLAVCFICSVVALYQPADPTQPNLLASSDILPEPSADILLLQDPSGSTIANSNAVQTVEDTSFKANIDEHLKELKTRIPPGDFHILLEPPFVVVGDQPLNKLKQSSRTVKWAVDRLKADYFLKDPNDIVDIWLFKDEESYYTNAEKLFGSRPTTIYGYYTPANKALVMNISTGGGTLVHERPPFYRKQFPCLPIVVQ